MSLGLTPFIKIVDTATSSSALRELFTWYDRMTSFDLSRPNRKQSVSVHSYAEVLVKTKLFLVQLASFFLETSSCTGIVSV